MEMAQKNDSMWTREFDMQFHRSKSVLEMLEAYEVQQAKLQKSIHKARQAIKSNTSLPGAAENMVGTDESLSEQEIFE